MNAHRNRLSSLKALALPALVLFLSSTASAGINLSVEASGVQASQRLGIRTETFDTVSASDRSRLNVSSDANVTAVTVADPASRLMATLYSMSSS